MKNLNLSVAQHDYHQPRRAAGTSVGAKNLCSNLIRTLATTLAAATLIATAARAATYDFLPVTIAGAGGKFTSPNGNGFITVTNTGGPFLSFNNTVWSSKFPNLFPASGTVQGWIAQADNNAVFTNTFYLANYALTPNTVFGIWNMTEETNTYSITTFAGSTQNAPVFTWSLMGYDDDALAGNIGWVHITLNASSGDLSMIPFTAMNTDSDAAFWTNIPATTTKIVVTGRLGAANADGVVFYFAEPSCISCPTNMTVTVCSNSAVVNYPAPTLSGACANGQVNCNPPSGSSFPVGTNVVTCTAVNGPQILGSCSFTITVLSNCPPTLVDCQCLANLPELHTNACPAYIPDLCQFSQCWLSPTPLQCNQSPPAGGQVGQGTYPITVVFTDLATGQTQTCVVNFVVSGCGTNCLPPPTGMVAWWPLDEGCGAGIFADLSGTGNAALVESGGPVCNPGSPNAVPVGKVAGANFFTGPTVRGRAPNAASLNFGTNSFSLDCWVKPVPFAGGRQPIVEKLDQPTPTTPFGYAVSILNGNVELRLGNGALYTHTGPAVNFSAWNFVGVVVNRTTGKVNFYVNGVAATPQTLALTGSINSTNDLLIGGTYAVNDPYGELTIDELELFNRALTLPDLNSLWNADSSGKCKPQSPCTNSVVSIFCPPDTNVETCTLSAIVFYPPPVASTSCGMITNLICTPASGSAFPIGTTTVTCTAKDSQGHTASCTFKVTVTPDHTPPACPPTSLSITGCPPRVPNFATNGLITDNCTPVGQISVVQNPLAGTVLPPGQTVVTLTACDAASNCVQCVVTLTAVYAGPPPVITCPSNIVANAYAWCTTNGVTVAYPPPQVSNGTLVSCTPPSSSFFPFGNTVVTCVATNQCATNQCTFTVTVNFGGAIPLCTPPPSNMVMWLKFDETSGTLAFNSSAGNLGLMANNPTHNLGQFVVNSLCFNGVNQYVQVQPYPAMQFGTGDFSVDAWVKPATLANTVRVIVDHREENGSVVRGYSLFLGANNTVGFQIADGTFVNYAFPSIVPADGQWHFVAVTVERNDPQGIKLYVDGVAEPNPRDPTLHPGSVTAGPCYPFRVASRSSSVSGLFPGCIDEVELFRRALAASEVQSIWNAQCKGKCRIACQAGGFSGFPECWLGHPITNSMVIVNPLPYPQTFNWSIQPLPVGPGCNKPGPTFSPSSGTVTIPAFNSALINTTVTLPPGFGVGDCSCWRLTVSTPDGSQQVTCDGSYCLPRTLGFCVTPTNPLGLATNLESGTVKFDFEGTGPAATTLSNLVAVLNSPDNEVLSVKPLPPLTIPPAGGGTVQVPTSFTLPEYDPGRIYHILLEADLDGTGQYTALASVPLINVVPATPEEGPLTVKRDIGGTIIIAWPNPCAVLEVNPNPANPAGWTTAPVQTSPWTFAPSNSPAGFFRLRQ